MLVIKSIKAGTTCCTFTTVPKNFLVNLLSIDSEPALLSEIEIYNNEISNLSYLNGCYFLETTSGLVNSVTDFFRFIRLLELKRMHYIEFILQSITDYQKGVIYKRSRNITAKGTIYKFDQNEKEEYINYSISNLGIHDEKLEKALIYYNHALFLLDGNCKSIEESQKQFYISEAILNFWKSVTIIIGEGKKWKSGLYNIGIVEQELVERTQKIFHTRNKKDVAHSSFETINLTNEVLNIETTTRIIIEKYICTIKNKNS